jgi:CheY-like chemotaxis protein
VLIVEDNPEVREATVTLLTTWGHTVETAADGEKGLALALSWSPDVVCIDLMLPRMNGAEIARRLTVALGDRRPVLLAVTAYGHAADRELATAAGFDGFIVKPVDTNVLERILGGALPLPPGVALPAAARLVDR